MEDGGVWAWMIEEEGRPLLGRVSVTLAGVPISHALQLARILI